MRLIDADALIALIPDASADVFENCRNCTCLNSEQIVELINKAPTVANVLPKEQKAVKIEVKKINNSGRCGRCPNCLMELNEMDYPNYCGYCGKAVKWYDSREV